MPLSSLKSTIVSRTCVTSAVSQPFRTRDAGFTEYKSGEIDSHDDDRPPAGSHETLPDLSGRVSISQWLLSDFLERGGDHVKAPELTREALAQAYAGQFPLL